MRALELLLAFAGSFAAGALGSLVGLVLGSLRLPAVLLASGSPAAAAGTNIAVSAAAAFTGGLAHARAGRVSWRIVAWMTPPSVVGAFVGGYFAHEVPSRALRYAPPQQAQLDVLPVGEHPQPCLPVASTSLFAP